MKQIRRSAKEVQEDIQVQSKVCCVCKERKPFESFYNSKNKSDGKSYRCKVCDHLARKEYHRKHRAIVKKKSREHRLRNVYNISHDDYLALLKSQDYSCAICGTHYTNNKVGHDSHFLSIDHCHDTGEIRGLLCNQCNRGVGMLQDSPAILLRAYKYLINDL